MDSSPNFLDPQALSELKDLRLRAAAIVDGLVSGMHRSPYQGHSVEFSQHREYVAGDEIRHVDWKVFARTDKIHLKQYEDETNLCCTLLVDQSESMGFAGPDAPWNKFEFGSCLAVAFAWLVLNQRDAVSIGTFADTLVPPARPTDQREAIDKIVNRLKSATPGGSTRFADCLNAFALENSRRQVVVLISDCFDEFDSVARGLEALRRRDHQVILLQVLDRSEIDFDFGEALELSGMESEPTFRVDPIAVQQAYRKVVEEKTAQLSTFCLNQQILFEQVCTQSNVGSVIRKLMQRNSGRRWMSK